LRRATVFAMCLLFLCGVARSQQLTPHADRFALKDGDRVVFYGDSITEQRFYTSDVEEFVLTRFPSSKVTFIQAGVGGDKVSGGRAGPDDLRVERDVLAYQPTVVTIMLGMNDGFYRLYDPGIFQSYADGYRHIVDSIQAKLPAVSFTLLKPSPYDDVTREPLLDNGGYNVVLQRFGDFIGQLAAEKHLQVADLNSPVVAALTKAKAIDPAFSTTLIPDRVHPGNSVHWLMAESILKVWGASPLVTSVTIDVSKPSVGEIANARITELHKSKGSLAWIETDQALPLPLPSSDSDPFVALAVHSSDLMEALDQETLRIQGLAPGKYELRIDDRTVGAFDQDQLAAGINLAPLETPMLDQARLVAFDTERRNDIDKTRANLVQMDMTAVSRAAATELSQFQERAVEQQRKDARPIPHRYSLSVLP
jgi:lysophospholipase L1-like esterase